MNNVYNELDKNYKQFYTKLDMALETFIRKYRTYFDSNKKDRIFILNNMSKDLEKISYLFDNYGYTYYPSNIEDISEDKFEEVVLRYLESFEKYLDDGASNLETLNVNIKTLLILIDKHKTITEHFE